MEASRLLRLLAPKGGRIGHQPSSGLDPEDEKEFAKLFRLDYMGAAEYEFGVTRQSAMYLATKGVPRPTSVEIGGKTFLVVIDLERVEAYKAHLVSLAKSNVDAIREYSGILDYVQGQPFEIDSLIGWLDIVNHAFVFGTSKEGLTAANKLPKLLVLED